MSFRMRLARRVHPERNKSALPARGVCAWGAGRGVRQCGKVLR
jgi:hypothetical protein